MTHLVEMVIFVLSDAEALAGKVREAIQKSAIFLGLRTVGCTTLLLV